MNMCGGCVWDFEKFSTTYLMWWVGRSMSCLPPVALEAAVQTF